MPRKKKMEVHTSNRNYITLGNRHSERFVDLTLQQFKRLILLILRTVVKLNVLLFLRFEQI